MKYIGYRSKRGRSRKYQGLLECAKRCVKLADGKLSDGGWHQRLIARIEARLAP